ncbi:hypothetical protein RvY_16806 [Ramazzottius varieornatus]|uniref:ZSWIM3 N-terminal domain-containing protein n=1 Tax=Ramazzottius varieornatus TaxID=947166 RepID=A0A1D1VZV0_RAMVA|nr:hypothetical protein RvY_16806 [Ramazzottius varieornatus]
MESLINGLPTFKVADLNAVITLGGSFQTYQEFERFMQLYKDETYTVWSVKKAQKLKDQYKDTLEYKFKHLVCKHHAGYEPVMDTERHHTRTSNTGCLAELYLSAESAQNRLIIRTFNNTHNHPVSAELYAQYPENRRLTEAEKNEARDLRANLVPSVAVARTLAQKSNKMVRRKDINNLRYRDDTKRQAGKTEIDLINEVLHDIKPSVALTWQVKHELWLCYSQGEEELRCRNESVRDQVNGVDCAFFALTFAAEIVAKKNPREASFSGQSLRSCVISSFTAKSATQVKRRPGRAAERVVLNYQDNFTFITPDDAVAYLAQWAPESQPNADRRVVPELSFLNSWLSK